MAAAAAATVGARRGRHGWSVEGEVDRNGSNLCETGTKDLDPEYHYNYSILFCWIWHVLVIFFSNY